MLISKVLVEGYDYGFDHHNTAMALEDVKFRDIHKYAIWQKGWGQLVARKITTENVKSVFFQDDAGYISFIECDFEGMGNGDCCP